MKALVLSAGYGERLRPLTNTIPKPLLEVGGRPLIHYPLLMLKAAGITEIAVNLHHLGDQLEQSLGSGAALGLSITYSREAVLMGTGGPLLMLRNYFKHEPFLILNCDTIMDLDLTSLIALHQSQSAIATLTLRRPDTTGYSQIEIDSQSQIRRMRLLKGGAPAVLQDYISPQPSTLPTAPLMYCGLMACDPMVLERLPQQAPFGLVADLLAPLLSEGYRQCGFVHQGFFRTVDDLAGYAQLNAEFRRPPPLSFLRG